MKTNETAQELINEVENGFYDGNDENYCITPFSKNTKLKNVMNELFYNGFTEIQRILPYENKYFIQYGVGAK